jgi:ABC-type uncharacterized transport system permease subunit
LGQRKSGLTCIRHDLLKADMTMPIHMGSAIMSLDVTSIMMTDTWLPVAYFFVHLSWSRPNNNCYTMTSKKTGVLELLFLEYWSIWVILLLVLLSVTGFLHVKMTHGLKIDQYSKKRSSNTPVFFDVIV